MDTAADGVATAEQLCRANELSCPPLPPDTCGTCPSAAPASSRGGGRQRSRQLQTFGDVNLHMKGENWEDWSTQDILGLPCTPRESFTALTFDFAQVVRSKCVRVAISTGSRPHARACPRGRS